MKACIYILFGPRFSGHVYCIIFRSHVLGKDWFFLLCILFPRGNFLVVGMPEIKNKLGMESWGLLVPHSKFDTMPFMD